ncbi:MAG: S41 family peptidase [Verrucomicrobiota bacterium]
MVNFGKAAEPTEIKGIAWPALSPDGQTLAFEWLNDLWLVPSSGGEARRLIGHDAREAYPKFTPDGKRVVFSSERTGAAQIFSVNLDGSELRQHSEHSEGNILEAISPDSTYALARGLRSASGYKPYRLLKVDLTGPSRELPLFDATAHSVSISAEGNRFLFCRGGEQLYRNGYQGSRASEIHVYDAVKQSFEVMVDEAWEAKSPMWMRDGEGFYYLSNKSGCFNLWLRRFAEKADKQLTFFKQESVVIPAMSANGKVIMFRAGGKVYQFSPESGEAPKEVNIFTSEKLPDTSVRKEKVSGTSSVVFCEGGQRIIFSAAGDLWTMKHSDKEPARLTSTDTTDERELQLSPDEKSLFYLSDDGLKVDVVTATFHNEKLGEAKRIFSGQRSKRNLRISPDGKWLSWLEGTGDLVTAKIGETGPRVVMKNWDMPTYDWASEGNWLVVAAEDIHSNRDIWLVPADASREAFNLTTHPAFEGSPKWSPDGRYLVFTARREIGGLSKLWTAEIGSRLSGTFVSDDELRSVAASIKPIETDVHEATRVAWTADSKSILFQPRDETENQIYSIALKGGLVKEFADFRGVFAGRGPDEKTYWRINRVPTVVDGKKHARFAISISVEQKRSERMKLGFRKIWRTLGERFYDDSMNGMDWDAMLEKYEEAAAATRDSRQFDRVVAQLLGELNASHLTFTCNRWGINSSSASEKQPTAHPGLEFEAKWDGPLVIKDVIAGAPIAKVADAPVAGEVVRRINGRDVDARTSLDQFFNGAKGRVIPIVIENSKGETRTLELVPVSYGRVRFLDRKQDEAEAKAAAEAHGFVYLPFLKMKSAELEKLSLEVYRASTHAKGIVLDLRDNAGGRVADELLALFCQPVHTFTIPREGPRGYPTERRVSPVWDGPMVVLTNGNTYSNAEIFCHAFKQYGRGKLVGTPTNGGVISAVGVKIPEMGELQIPFRGWFHATNGKDLELNGAVPDVLVPMLPEDEMRSSDPQLKAAIQVLVEEVKGAAKPVEPRLKSESGK